MAISKGQYDFLTIFEPQMQGFRQHIIFRLFWLFMAVHILNCSVDSPDSQLDNVSEDLSYNDMESVVEIVLEDVLDIKDAIAEHDENDTEDDNSLNFKKEIVYYHRTKVEKNTAFEFGLKITVTTDYKEQYTSQFHPEIVPPPPKA